MVKCAERPNDRRRGRARGAPPENPSMSGAGTVRAGVIARARARTKPERTASLGANRGF